jgi:superfamily II DNA or RNA helicase
MRTGARRHIVHDFKMGNIKVLLNYGIFSTGLDVPKLDTVVISRPTSSVVLYSQMIGRGIRGNMVGGTEECRLIDIRDNFLNYGDVDSVYQYFKDDWSRG